VDDEFYRTLVMAAGAFDYYFHVKRCVAVAVAEREHRRMRDRMREIIGFRTRTSSSSDKSRMHYTLC
jgi:hypothetical protein